MRIGRALGLNVLAEGVETEEELEALSKIGCSRMQGYYLSKPISKQDFEREVASDQARWRMAMAEPASWCPPEEREGDTAPDLDGSPKDDDELLPALAHDARPGRS